MTLPGTNPKIGGGSPFPHAPAMDIWPGFILSVGLSWARQSWPYRIPRYSWGDTILFPIGFLAGFTLLALPGGILLRDPDHRIPHVQADEDQGVPNPVDEPCPDRCLADSGDDLVPGRCQDLYSAGIAPAGSGRAGRGFQPGLYPPGHSIKPFHRMECMSGSRRTGDG